MEAIYRVPLHLKNKVKQIGYDEIGRVRELRWWKLIAIIGWLAFFTAILLSSCDKDPVWAEEIDDTLAVRAIIGEASGEGYQGMLAVAVGIRNRNTLQGVYGLKTRHKEPKWVWDMARKAWKESEYNRIHSGTHWESIDFPKPKWTDKMRIVYRYKKHIFYK